MQSAEQIMLPCVALLSCGAPELTRTLVGLFPATICDRQSLCPAGCCHLRDSHTYRRFPVDS